MYAKVERANKNVVRGRIFAKNPPIEVCEIHAEKLCQTLAIADPVERPLYRALGGRARFGHACGLLCQDDRQQVQPQRLEKVVAESDLACALLVLGLCVST